MSNAAGFCPDVDYEDILATNFISITFNEPLVM
jgi:hypothetical protein